jgi:two-component system, OmpR family, response regulator
VPDSGLPRVLVIEDEPTLREAVASALTAHGYTVAVRSDGTDLDAAVTAVRPDLVILDVSLPAGPDGFELSLRVRSSWGLPVIFLTAADSVDERVRGFDSGADDYVTKPFEIVELLVRIRAVLRRAGRAVSPTIEVRDLVVDLAAREATRGGARLPLTPTEFDLLAALARTSGRAWTKRELLTEVWGFDEYQPHLVEVHISTLRHKVEAHGSRLIQTERGGRYVLR